MSTILPATAKQKLSFEEASLIGSTQIQMNLTRDAIGNFCDKIEVRIFDPNCDDDTTQKVKDLVSEQLDNITGILTISRGLSAKYAVDEYTSKRIEQIDSDLQKYKERIDAIDHVCLLRLANNRSNLPELRLQQEKTVESLKAQQSKNPNNQDLLTELIKGENRLEIFTKELKWYGDSWYGDTWYRNKYRLIEEQLQHSSFRKLEEERLPPQPLIPYKQPTSDEFVDSGEYINRLGERNFEQYYDFLLLGTATTGSQNTLARIHARLVEINQDLSNRPYAHIYHIHRQEKPHHDFSSADYGREAFGDSSRTSFDEQRRCFARTTIECGLEKLKSSIELQKEEHILNFLLEKLRDTPITPKDLPVNVRNVEEILYSKIYQRIKNMPNPPVNPDDAAFNYNFGAYAFNREAGVNLDSHLIAVIDETKELLKQTWKA